MALEPAFWDALERLAARRGMSLGHLVAAVDAERGGPMPPLASALRVLALRDAPREG